MGNELQTLGVQVIAKEGSIQFENFTQLKAQINSALDQYKGLVLTDDNKQELKGVKANLNKLSKALDDERKTVKKEYVKPLELFEIQVKELVELVKDASGEIDVQIKAQEDAEKLEKRQELELYFNELVKTNKIDFLTFDDLGLNITLTATEKKLKEEITAFIEKVLLDLEEIKSDANGTRLLAKYRLSKNLQQSRIQLNYELQQEQVIVKEEPKVETPKVETVDQVDDEVLEITFTVTAPKSKLIALREYMKVNGIKYE